MGKRTFDANNESDTSSKAPRQMKSQVPKKMSKKTTIVLGAICGVFVVGAVSMAALGIHEKTEDKEIAEMWDNVKDIAEVHDVPDVPKASDPTSDFIPKTEPLFSSDTTEEEPVTATVVAEDGTEIVLKEKYSENPMDRKLDWTSLQSINPDICCWVYIPGTGVDYPVLQEKEFGKAFYLTHNVYKVVQKSGAIFIPHPQNEGDVDYHTVMFGHHMKNGSMFGILTKYKDKSFYDDHQYIYVYYPDKTEKWGIWTAEHVTEDDKVYLIPYMDGSVEYADLISYLEEKSVYKTEYFGKVDNMQRTLTLSTCDHTGRKTEGDSGRFIVNAMLLDAVTPTGEFIYKTTDKLNELNVNENVIISDEDEEYDGYEIDADVDSELAVPDIDSSSDASSNPSGNTNVTTDLSNSAASDVSTID